MATIVSSSCMKAEDSALKVLKWVLLTNRCGIITTGRDTSKRWSGLQLSRGITLSNPIEPDANDRARQRRKARQASGAANFDRYGQSFSHPTLTPKGYDLMNSSPLKDQSYAMPSPSYRSADPPTTPIEGQDDQPIIVGDRRVPATRWPGPYFRERVADGVPQNFLASKKFPDPNDLVHQPLHRYFQTRQVQSTVAALPVQAIGRLVIHIDANSWDQPAFGSAWIVGKNLIATCAHNLFDSNKRRWSRSIEFYPGFDYYSGSAPVHCKVTSCYVPSAYLRNPATNDDIGFCYVDQDVEEIVGQSIAIQPPETNAFYENHSVVIAGYPAASEFDFGKQLWVSRGEYLFGHRMGPGDDYSPVIATNFGGGASGGPWLVQDSKNQRWSAVGLTSGHARLHYHRGELNLMSLSSPMITQARMDRIQTDRVTHRFDV